MFFRFVLFIIAFVFGLFASTHAFSQAQYAEIAHDRDPRGLPELVICGQNLANFGSFVDMRKRVKILTPSIYGGKVAALARRFVMLQCDIIALQEALGSSRERTVESLQTLTGEMRRRSGRVFDAYAGDSNDKFLRNAFLVARDRAEVLNTVSYAGVDLPRLSQKQRPRKFVRGPFEIEVLVKPKGDAEQKKIFLVSYHLKSQRNIPADPAELEWETYRMEMTEAIRQIVMKRHAGIFEEGGDILVVLGDRNSNFDSASARILEGKLELGHFQEDPICRLSKRAVPLCKPGNVKPAVLFSVLTNSAGIRNFPGTYRYKDIFSWLDDIALPEINLPFARVKYDVEGEYDAGVIYEPKEASDHGMTWVRLNW